MALMCALHRYSASLEWRPSLQHCLESLRERQREQDTIPNFRLAHCSGGPRRRLKNGSRDDNAEGAAVFSWFAPNDSVLVVYDTPSAQWRYGLDGVLADVFRF